MNPFEMVVLIVAICAIASIFRARYGIRRGAPGDEPPVRDDASEAENAQLRAELKRLKERVATLERIATDSATDSATALDREIEALRQRD